MDRVLERDAELARLDAALSRAASGAGSLVLVAGEAGAGKTSLVRAFARRAAATGAAVWECHCEPLSVPIPLAPIRELAAAAGNPGLDGDGLAIARGLRGQVDGTTAIVLEDLHWADAATLDVVRLLASGIERAPVLLLATYRDDELEAHRELALLVGDLVSHPAAVRLHPAPFTSAAVTELAAPAGLDPAELLRLTGGNPLLVVESIAAPGEGVPKTVRDATLARARRLGAGARGALDAAAAIGQDVPLDLLREVSATDTAAIEECLAHGVLVGDGATVTFRHELIRQAVETSISPARRTELHARVLGALRARDAAPARLAHHAELAGATELVRRYATEAAREAHRVGAHADAARQYDRVLAHGVADPRDRVELQVAFGQAAQFAGRDADAMRALREAVATAEGLGDAGLHARALSELSAELWAVGRFAESLDTQRSAVAAIEDGDDIAALAIARSALVRRLSVGIDPAAALVEAPRALAEAERAGLMAQQVEVRISRALALGHRGDPAAGVELAACLEAALATGSHQAVIRSYVNGCWVAGINRDHAAIDALAPRALAFFEQIQVLHPRDDVCGMLARSHLDRARYDDAIRWSVASQRSPHLERAVAIAIAALAQLRRGGAADVDGPNTDVEANDTYRRPQVAAARAEAAWLRGDLAAGREHVRGGFAVAGFEQCARTAGDLALWAMRCGEPVPELPFVPEPVRLELAGDWRGAIRAWEALECPYDAAL
ncbi:MAG: hypothetical protein QOE28_2011, partial [Solirubrobacteraceae bacterium]|nr:hypothetical protein [Solirubrobacteraceae bacterium]